MVSAYKDYEKLFGSLFRATNGLCGWRGDNDVRIVFRFIYQIEYDDLVNTIIFCIFAAK